MKTSLFLLLLCLAFPACRSLKNAPELSAYNGRQILFGSGGGFTGAVTTYALLESGHVYRRDGMLDSGIFQVINNAGKGRAKSMFNRAGKLRLEDVDRNHPGNIYYFLELPFTGSKTRVVWGDPAHPAPSVVQTLYDDLLTLTVSIVSK